MNTRLFPDQQERISHEMSLARVFDGDHFWNTASAVRDLYVVDSLPIRILRWLSA